MLILHHRLLINELGVVAGAVATTYTSSGYLVLSDVVALQELSPIQLLVEGLLLSLNVGHLKVNALALPSEVHAYCLSRNIPTGLD